MSENIIEIEDLHKQFGTHKVLNGVNLKIEKGKSLVILGGSGTGKSVLIKTIIGLIEPSSGKIFIDGINKADYNSKLRSHFLKRCGFLFQAGALFDSLNVEDNITFFASRLYNLSLKRKRELAAEKLRSVGLSERVLKLFPSELSGGMQKRVSLARSICTDPEIIFFDEPTTGLDPVMSNVINELIHNATKKLGATSITITHDMNSAKKIADKIAMIYNGQIIWQGSVNQLENCTDPIVSQFVNGRTEGPISLI
jgi:phospholipid/cholesterol/gamma-HCH transport system ATP-binding protein